MSGVYPEKFNCRKGLVKFSQTFGCWLKIKLKIYLLIK